MCPCMTLEWFQRLKRNIFRTHSTKEQVCTQEIAVRGTTVAAVLFPTATLSMQGAVGEGRGRTSSGIWELSLLTPGLAATEVMVAIHFCPKPRRLRQSGLTPAGPHSIFSCTAQPQFKLLRVTTLRLTDTENTWSAQTSRDREDRERQTQRTNRKNVHYPFRFSQLLS